jgi:hypothetical protein
VCVVEGQEGDDGQQIKYPKGTKMDVASWNFCWFVLAASCLTSFVIWIFIHYWIKDDFNYNPPQEVNEQQAKEKEKKRRILILKSTILIMTLFLIVLEICIIIILSLIIKDAIETKVYVYVFYGISVVSIIIGLISNCCSCCICGIEGPKCNYYKSGSCFLFPCLLQTVHHVLWAVCGIISEPYWATPIFLIECLFGFIVMYAIFLYQKDVVWGETISEGKCWVVGHLVLTVVAFVFVLLVVIFVGHGHIVNVSTAGVIEVIITITLIWLIKNSGLQLKSFKKKKKKTK